MPLFGKFHSWQHWALPRLFRTRMDIVARRGLLQERAQLLLRTLLRSVSGVAVG